MNIYEEVFGVWGGYNAVSMDFLCSQVYCGGGYREIVGKVFAEHFDTHSVVLFLLGYDGEEKVSVGYLDVFGNLVSVDEETRVCYIYIYGSLE